MNNPILPMPGDARVAGATHESAPTAERTFCKRERVGSPPANDEI